jgi:hypothetical protein
LEIQPALAERRIVVRRRVDTAWPLRAAGITSAWLKNLFNFAPRPAVRRYVTGGAGPRGVGSGRVRGVLLRTAAWHPAAADAPAIARPREGAHRDQRAGVDVRYGRAFATSALTKSARLREAPQVVHLGPNSAFEYGFSGRYAVLDLRAFFSISRSIQPRVSVGAVAGGNRPASRPAGGAGQHTSRLVLQIAGVHHAHRQAVRLASARQDAGKIGYVGPSMNVLLLSQPMVNRFCCRTAR